MIIIKFVSNHGRDVEGAFINYIKFTNTMVEWCKAVGIQPNWSEGKDTEDGHNVVYFAFSGFDGEVDAFFHKCADAFDVVYMEKKYITMDAIFECEKAEPFHLDDDGRDYDAEGVGQSKCDKCKGNFYNVYMLDVDGHHICQDCYLEQRKAK